MNYYNSDGTIAEMCGNGARCTAKFFIEQTGINKKEINLETRAGIKNIKINENDTYSVDMGSPIFESSDFPTYTSPTGILIEGYDFHCVSMGNPHAVTQVDNLNNIDIKEIGPKVETNPLFPNRINVEFVEKVNDNYYKVKVWERGSGVTLACGTGACAVFSILSIFSPMSNIGENEITLEFTGGKLYLSRNEKGHIVLRGPATFVFEGEINILSFS
jgi:diaminopimelate epimerase